MANGNVEYMFMGNPDCAICGGLAGTTDSKPIPPPHENCHCETEATGCEENEYSYTGGGGRHNGHSTFDVEITVTCWDGTEIGQSVSLEVGPDDLSEGWWEAIEDRIGDIAAELAEGCPDCKPPLVS
jgi:hypothetical protein